MNANIVIARSVSLSLWMCLLVIPTVAGDDNQRVRTILFLGDSLTAGFGVTPEEAFPSLIEKKILQAGLRARVINAGVSGNTTAGGLRRLSWYFQQPIDILVLALGANDGLRGISPAASRANLQQIIDRAREQNPAIEIVLVGMKLPPNMGDDYSAEFTSIFPELQKANGTALVPFLLEGVGGVRTLNLPDGVHPNPQGHIVMCNNVWRVLVPFLEKP